MTLRLLAITLCSAVLFLASCSQARLGVRPDDTSGIIPGSTTKSELYDQLGVPADVFVSAHDHEVLLYTQRVRKGMAMGLTWGFSASPLLAIGHSHVGSDSWVIVLDPNDVVKSVTPANYSHLAEPKLWPF